jgi:DNA-binding CsgD family transcriptional regulator
MRTQKIAERQRLAQQVRSLRANGLSPTEVGTRLQIPPWLVSRLERGDIAPRVVTEAIAADFSKQVWALRNQGIPDTEIAVRLDVTISTICYWAGPSGIADRQAQRRAMAFQLCAEGASHSEIIKRMGAAESTVTKWIKQYRKSILP